VGVIFGVAACGGESAQSEGFSGVAEEALSDSCAGAGVDATRTGAIDPEIVSPQTYNRCTKSYVVEVDNVSAAYAGPGSGGGPPGRVEIRWADTFTNTQAGCEDLHGAAIIFKWNGSSWTNVYGSNVQLSSDGAWLASLGFCAPPIISFNDVEEGASYKIAATMRLNSGTNPTRKVGILSREPVDL
ncbi:MAG TPA: hypothetical protein VHM25_02290, partial [Polyangiaceae bacterium]|nr:hypothetical protein [Polyangiaceae bacterium]